ncbi:unnamed protein product [marine sediment metagenome]|uniref:Uncharacterized protein n=1 Tax=marine sediment metagenome TaxID=412755 RepID=X1A3L5_9ZZZZ
MMAECDFYMNLYEDFIKTRNDENDKILWKMYKILDLMKVADEKDQNGFVENGLRMIMLLFNNFIINSCDISSSDLNETSSDKKEELICMLKKEFI